MFERFDHDARAAVAHARDEAARSGKREIGTEHLLLGLLSRPGHASDALTAAGADKEDLRTQIAPGDAATAAAGPAAEQSASEELSAHDVDQLPLTHHARRALELALQATHRLRHRHVSSGHILLGIIEQPHNGGLQALSVAGIRVGTLRADVLQRMTSGTEGDIA